MKDFKFFIKETFDSYKCKNRFDILKCLPVYNDENELIAYLRPITSDYRQSIRNCAEFMGDWRAQNPSISNSTFDITIERTERWLDNLIIGRDDRLLFLIQMLNGEYVGHVGYSSFNYDLELAEIDSILRGVKNAYPGIMTYSIRTLLWWGKNVIKLKEIELSTEEDNAKSMALYERCSFIIKKKKALIKVVKEDEVRWDPAENEDMENAERYSIVMKYNGD